MFEIFLLILSVAVGCVLGQAFVNNQKLSKFLLTFSGAYFLGITVLEIFPTVYEGHSHSIGLFVLVGLLFQIVAESLSKGAEHGHIHLDKNEQIPFGLFLGLFLHSFFEAMPIMHHRSHDLLWAIVVHNVPISMVIYATISKLKVRMFSKVLFMVAFALAGPLGLLFGGTVLADYQKEATAFVAGILLHIATVILFESSDNHKFKTQKMITLLLGFVLAYLTIGLGHSH